MASKMTVQRLLRGVVDHIEKLPSNILSIEVSGLTINSKTILPGVAFIAIPGGSYDGRNYMQQCEDAPVIFAHSDTLYSSYMGRVPVVHIPRLKQRVGCLSSNFFGHPSKQCSLVGVTGTNGKTTFAHLFSQVLAKLAGTCGHIGTLGNGVFDSANSQSLCSTGLTTPSPVAIQEALADFVKTAKFVAMEVSSHGLSQSRVDGCQFRAAVLTNLSRDHLDFHGTFENYKNAKAKLFREFDPEFSVVNIDDIFGRELFDELSEKGSIVYGYTAEKNQYSQSNSKPTVFVSGVSFGVDGLSMHIATPWGEQDVHSPLFGAYNAMNIAAVITCACAMGFSLAKVANAVSHLQAVPGRMQRVEIESSDKMRLPTTFVDFAHTPDALTKVLSDLKKICTDKLWVVVGCGGDRDAGKRPLMAQSAFKHAHQCVFTSDNPRSEDPNKILSDMVSAVDSQDDVAVIEDRKNAIEYAVGNAGASDIIVIAGKGHEKFQLINNEKIPFDDVLVARQALSNEVQNMRGHAS